MVSLYEFPGDFEIDHYKKEWVRLSMLWEPVGSQVSCVDGLCNLLLNCFLIESKSTNIANENFKTII